MRALGIVVAICVAICATPTKAQAYDFQAGQIVAVDGDTLRIGSQRIRLSAMDAPELSQTCRTGNGAVTLCGRDARNALSRLVRNGARCILETYDRYSRAVATCTNSAGVEIGREMIRMGWAVPYWRYGGARYSKAYDEALATDAGMHAGKFIEPESWRRGERW